jgi:NADPH:quinone reductase-like Zn-dependent oxidoreductase
MVGSREMFARMNAALAARPLAPVIDRIVGFDEAPSAFAHLASRTHVGKVAIRVT